MNTHYQTTQKSRINVCFFSSDAYPYFNPNTQAKLGGAEYQLYLFATELAKDASFEVHMIVDQTLPGGTEVRENVTLHEFRISTDGLKYLKTLLRLIPAFRLFQHIDADIYIQRGASYWTGFAQCFAQMLGKKFIYMIAHDGDTDRALHPRHTGIVRRMMWWVYEYGMHRANLVVAQNEFQQEHLENNYQKGSVLRPSAHRIPITPTDTEKTTILWVGRAKEWKRPDLFVQLARAFPNEQFEMVMPSFGDVTKKTAQIRKDASETSNIIFHEYVSPRDIDMLFERAKVYVLTSTDEGFPNTFIQAAKARTPILSYCINPNNMLERHTIGYNANRNEQKLKDYLLQLLTDDMLRNNMADNAFAYVKGHHDIREIIENDKRTLRSLLKRSSPDTPTCSE